MNDHTDTRDFLQIAAEDKPMVKFTETDPHSSASLPRNVEEGEALSRARERSGVNLSSEHQVPTWQKKDFLKMLKTSLWT